MAAWFRPAIVVGIDGSRAGLLALDWAVALAARRHWEVRAVQVADDNRPAQPLVAAPVRDDSAEVLLDLARSAQLLVIGRRGGGGFDELTLGSTSQVCTALTRTSTVVVPDDWARGEGDLGMVVVGVDGSDACQAALGFAFEFAAERGAELTIVHVPRAPQDVPPPGVWIDPADTPWYRDARQLVTDSLAGWPDKYPEVVFRTHYRPGHPVQVLAQHSKAADLIVVGGVGRAELTPLRLGSVSRGLLHHTQCPVAIVHNESSSRG